MDSALTLLFGVILLSTFSVHFTSGSDDFSTQWIGPSEDRIVRTLDIDRQDRGILYGIIVSNYSVIEDVLELYLELPELELQKVAVFPKYRLDAVLLHSFGSHHVIVIHSGRRYNETIVALQGIVIDMVKSLTYKMDIPFNFYQNHMLDLVVHSNTFDLIVENRSLCRTTDKCRITYNKVGQRVGEPKVLHSKRIWQTFTVVSANQDSLDDGYTVEFYDEIKKQRHILFHDKDGSEKAVKGDSSLQHTVSNSHNVFTNCGLTKDFHVQCLRYDWNTKRMTHNSAPLNGAASELSVANLAGGDLVFSTTDCPDSLTECLLNSFDVTITDARGRTKYAGSFSLNLHCSRHTLVTPYGLRTVQSTIAEIGDEICFSFSCSYELKRHHFQFYNKCIPKNIFEISESPE